MRIYLKLSANRTLVDFNYQVKLVGALHKWLGPNQLHGQKRALYSMSWLSGGKSAAEVGLNFQYGAEWFISAHNTDFIKQIVSGILDDPSVAYGMKVQDISLSETPHFEGETRFLLGSPVLVKFDTEGKQHHFTFHETEADTLLTKTLCQKLSQANLSSDGVSVHFDRQSQRAKTKVATYRAIRNKVNYCPVIITGSPEQLGFAWNVGVGQSTGIGFGSLI